MSIVDACTDYCSATRAYLDNAATTPILPEALEAMTDALALRLGNASALHAKGRAAKTLLEQSRSVIAESLQVDPDEVFFTSGGTESNNLGITGAAKLVRSRSPRQDTIVTSTLEHASVTKTVRGLRREGWSARYVKAPFGKLDFDDLIEKLDDRVALVSIMRVQNEAGFIFPIDEVSEKAREHSPCALVHTDGVQAFGKVDFFPREMGVDLASLCSHKIGGPQGIGALYVKEGIKPFTTAFGGNQERGLRSGTESIPLIVGFARAVEVVMANRKKQTGRLKKLKERTVKRIVEIWPDAIVNSLENGSPYVISVSFPSIDNGIDLTFFDERGVCVSRASACSTLHPNLPEEELKKKHPQSLLMAGVKKELLDSTLRLSFSQATQDDEIETFIQVLAEYRDYYRQSLE